MVRPTGFSVASAAAAAVLAAGALSGCASRADGSLGAAGGSSTSTASSSAGSPVPALSLPPGQAGAAAAATVTPVATIPAGSVPNTTGGATKAGLPQCTTADLSPEANVVADSAAAGHVTLNITITNTSAHKCTVYGFPGLDLEDKNQDAQPTKVIWDPSVAKTEITLAGGQSASSSARIDDDVPGSGEPQTGPCEAASYYLQITPPNNTTQLVAAIGGTGGGGITVCESGTMDVLALVPGSVGPRE